MRWLANFGVGVFVAIVSYVLIGWKLYDFDLPNYVAEPGHRIINEKEFEGTHTWTRVVTLQFSGYEMRPYTFSPMDGVTSWVNQRFGWCFSPLVSVVRRCQGLAFRGEEHRDEQRDPPIYECGPPIRWVVLDP
jgi:hypothetical protein